VRRGKVADLEERRAARDAERLGFLGARHHAAVVVREHNDGAAAQLGAEDPVHRGIERVAVEVKDERTRPPLP
jgi:hypothetical protein